MCVWLGGGGGRVVVMARFDLLYVNNMIYVMCTSGLYLCASILAGTERSTQFCLSC